MGRALQPRDCRHAPRSSHLLHVVGDRAQLRQLHALHGSEFTSGSPFSHPTCDKHHPNFAKERTMTVTTTTPSLRDVAESGGNPLKLKRIHHVEFWVGNAKQAAFYYRKAFGFSQL